jgi:hypothetical protein
MNELIVVARRTEALEVLRSMASGKTVSEACAEIGIDPRTFRKYLGDAKESSALFQELLSQSSREQIGILLGYRGLILEKLMADALSPMAETKDRLAIFITFEKYLRQVMDEERIGAGDNAAAESVLAGPVFTPGVSRFSITKTTTVTVEKEPVPNSEQTLDVIEGEVTSPDILQLPADRDQQSNCSA